MGLFTAINSKFWTHYLRARGARVGRNLIVNGMIDIVLRDGAQLSNLVIGDHVTLGGRVFIRMRKNGRIILANGVRTGTHVWLVTANDAEFRVGENSILSSYSIFNGGHGISIGADCIFAAFVYINSSEHFFKRGELIQKQGFFGAPVEIGDDVWLGGHLSINKGVKIGTGAVVGAGSVVTKDIPEYKVAVGNPAKVVKDRD
jgi:acetyltransferase-like isoleucine patch superfamily enzyme